MADILRERERQVYRKGQEQTFQIDCEKQSVAGSVSQRACVFCGSRVVLYPIVDALHIVHGPIGCASYTWDIRGALSSGPELHRLSFSTDMQELDVVHGGEKKLRAALCELIDEHKPKAAFVYATCIVGVIGDDMEAVCKSVSEEKGIPVLAVHSEGFKGTKKDGYKAACDALLTLVGTGSTDGISPKSINILGDFNLAGETWMIRDYYARMGVEVVSCITGDGRIDDIRRSHGAALNVVQCSGSMTYLAKSMKEKYGIPFIRVSYFGVEDMSKSLYDVAKHFKDKEMLKRTQAMVREELQRILPQLAEYRKVLEGKRAAIYVGGAFKAFSLVSALRHLGMTTVMVGSQTGNKDDYEQLRELCDEGTIIVDDSNPLELSSFLEEKDVDVFIGGVKERPIAYKLGIGFCDHNHERKEALAGFEGMLNFASEVHGSVMSPVWRLTPRKRASTLQPATPGDPAGGAEMSTPTGATRIKKTPRPNWVSTRNPCKACAPLGATLVMRGIEGALPFLHGSQGCATYMRRYLISHFREPMDIATSGFSEATTVFGGKENLCLGLDNVTSQYHPTLIGIATTCLTETIGEDVPGMLREYRKSTEGKETPLLVQVSTPSYSGTHIDGFNDAVRAVIEQLAEPGTGPAAYKGSFVNLFPGMVSAEDLRFLKQVAADFGLQMTVFPDYSETLDGESMEKYKKIPDGGTRIAALRASASAAASIEFGRTLLGKKTAASFLQERFEVPAKRIGLPIGVQETDAFFAAMEELSGHETPLKYRQERGRLVDAYVDGHKYLFGKRAIVIGDEDLVVGVTSLLAETGVVPVLCASGGKSGALAKSIAEVSSHLREPVAVRDGVDYMTIAEEVELKDLKPDFVIGNSKAAKLARALGVPLIRVGFPVHDRLGGQRILHVGYDGAQRLFDLIVNTLLELKQDSNSIGYSYL